MQMPWLIIWLHFLLLSKPNVCHVASVPFCHSHSNSAQSIKDIFWKLGHSLLGQSICQHFFFLKGFQQNELKMLHERDITAYCNLDSLRFGAQDGTAAKLFTMIFFAFFTYDLLYGLIQKVMNDLKRTRLLAVLLSGSFHVSLQSLRSTSDSHEDWKRETTCWGEREGKEANYTTARKPVPL